MISDEVADAGEAVAILMGAKVVHVFNGSPTNRPYSCILCGRRAGPDSAYYPDGVKRKLALINQGPYLYVYCDGSVE
jgi:hypothetical protein